MNTINFTANLIKHTQIPKRFVDDEYYPSTVSIVELDKNNDTDVEALKQTSYLWNDQQAKYSSNIYHEAVKGYDYDNIEAEHFLALTEQTGSYERLNPNCILGLMLFSQTYDDEDEITWLQVRPNTYSKQTWKREYKEVGKSLIDLLKETKLKKPIHVQSSNEAVEFYKKQGFTTREDDGGTSLYLEI